MAIKRFQFTLDSYIEREATTMALADHKNVVKFLGLEQIKTLDENVLIMEYCEGHVHDLVALNPNGMKSCDFLTFLQNVVDAMQHLKERNLIHRDIKPSNILVSKSYDGQTINKLADFGSTRVLKPNDSYGSLYGTYEYIHPDIFAKYFAKALHIIPPVQAFTYSHELWSLGVTFYEVATGQLPFNPKNSRSNPKTM